MLLMSNSAKNCILRRGMMFSLLGNAVQNILNVYPGSSSGAAHLCLLVYSGAQPTASQVIANWNSTYKPGVASTLLACVHPYLTGTYVASNSLDVMLVPIQYTGLNMSAYLVKPQTFTSIGTGIASWVILSPIYDYRTRVLDASSTFLVCPVSDTAGSAPIKLRTTSLVQGTSVYVDHVGMNLLR